MEMAADNIREQGACLGVAVARGPQNIVAPVFP